MEDFDPIRKVEELRKSLADWEFGIEARMEGVLGEIDPEVSEMSKLAYQCVFNICDEMHPSQREAAKRLLIRLIDFAKTFERPADMAEDYNEYVATDTFFSGDFDFALQYRHDHNESNEEIIDLLFRLTRIEDLISQRQIILMAMQRRLLYEDGWTEPQGGRGPLHFFEDVVEILYVLSGDTMYRLGHLDL